MANLVFTNPSPFAQAVIVVTDPEKQLQRAVKVAAAGTLSVDETLVSYSGDLYQKVADNRLVVTTGTMPARAYTAANTPVYNEQPESSQVAAEAGAALAKIVSFDSAASAGGAASEVLTVTGLQTTDTILAVSQKTKGANGTAIINFGTLIANGLTVEYTADPGAGSIVTVLVKQA